MDNYQFTLHGDAKEDILVAQITSGKNNSKLLWLSKDGKQENEIIQNKADLLIEFINEKRYRIGQNKIDELFKFIKDDEEPMDKAMKQIYLEFNNEYKKSNEVKTSDELRALPLNYHKGKRDAIFVCGCAGSGKSYFIGQYCESYNRMYPKSNIIFISAKNLKDDDAYDNVKNIKQLDLDDIEQLDEIVESGKAFEYFAGKESSLVIFDDAEGLTKELEKYAQLIMENILFIGRSKNINIIISRHILNNGKSTKPMFNECNKFVFFPNGLSRYNLDYTLKNYLGFDKIQIKKLCNLKTRWVQISNHQPRYVLYQKGVYLL